jgi:hypothetical protein
MTLPKITLNLPELTINPVKVAQGPLSEPLTTTSEQASGESILNLS